MILFSYGLEFEMRGEGLLIINGKIGQLRQKRRLEVFSIKYLKKR